MKQRLPVEIAPVHDDGLYAGFLIRVGGGQLTRREVEGWFLRHHPLVRRAVEVILAFVGCNTSVATAPMITRWGGSAYEMTGVTAMLRVILGRGAKVSVVPAAHVAGSRMPF